MTIIKLISTIITWIFLTFIACSTTTSKTFAPDITNPDTVYSASTKQLKSDKIPDTVFQMTNLRHLSINGEDCDRKVLDKDGNDITQCWMIKEIPSQIKSLKMLATLSLTLNTISKIPQELTQLNNLKLIDLTDNAGLTNIDNLEKLPGLQYLYLYGCGLTKLPHNIGDLKNLKELGLVGNNIDNTELLRIKKALPNCIIKY